jgi:hemerythrin superfamily protein
MDALLLLTGDHNRVRGLFKRFEAADEAKDERTAAALATTIMNELDVHATIEEDVFYPAIKDASEELGEIVAEGIEEHHVVKVLMGEIKELTRSDEAWSAKMKVLIENVEHHADEEEKEMFPKVRTALGASGLEELGERLEARKAELGAPTIADKIDLTKTDLEKLASDQEIPGRSNMSTEELLAAVAPG